LAAAFRRQAEIRGYAEELRALGIEVTSRWLHEPESPAKPNIQAAEDDLHDLDEADVLISFTEPPDSDVNPRGGRHVEFGFALAEDKELWVIGYRENIFHHLPEVKFFPSWAAVMAEAHKLKEWFA
jgi:nucleoside 2-deoxyribosyltransferase